MSEESQPIIVKKIKKGGGHHGGAWKVAYADFVTAMMAFFLLMWLLNATTEDQRKGIADYFDPKIPIGRVSGGGDGVLKGDSFFADEALVRDGTGGRREAPHESTGSRTHVLPSPRLAGRGLLGIYRPQPTWTGAVTPTPQPRQLLILNILVRD